ncbi:MAG: hypothetical protein ABMA64_18225 [Myxococcota bacterium]
MIVGWGATALAAPVEQGLRAEIYPGAFEFVAEQLTAGPFEFGPTDIHTSYDCYDTLDVTNFNITIEVENASIALEQDRLTVDFDLGTVQGLDVGITGETGWLTLCFDFDATIEYFQLIDAHVHGVLTPVETEDGVVLAFADPPQLTGTFDSDIDWFPDDIVWTFLGDVVLDELEEYIDTMLPTLLGEPITGVMDSPFGAFPLSVDVSALSAAPDGLYAAADVDLGGAGDSSPPSLVLGQRGDSHLAVAMTDGMVRDLLGVAWTSGVLDEDNEATQALLADLVSTVGLPEDVATTLSIEGSPDVTITPEGVSLQLPLTTLEASAGGEQLLRMVVDLDGLLEPNVEASEGSVSMSAHELTIDVRELDTSHLMANEDGDDHLASFLEGWVADAIGASLDDTRLFDSKFAAMGYVIRLDQITLQDRGAATWFTLFDAEDPEVDLAPPDTVVATKDTEEGLSVSLGGVDDRPGALTWSYRLDSKSWSTWSDVTEVSLDGLDVGEHTIEARARDEWQNEDPTPALASFEVTDEPAHKGCGCDGTGGVAAIGWLAAALAARRRR